MAPPPAELRRAASSLSTASAASAVSTASQNSAVTPTAANDAAVSSAGPAASSSGNVLQTHKSRILKESSSGSQDKLMKTQKEFLEWTKANLGFSKSTTYEYIISYRIYMEIANKIPKGFHPPLYQSHCQLLSKVPSKKLVETWLDVCRQVPDGVITTAVSNSHLAESYLDKNNLRGPKASSGGRGGNNGTRGGAYHEDTKDDDDDEDDDDPPSQRSTTSNFDPVTASVLAGATAAASSNPTGANALSLSASATAAGNGSSSASMSQINNNTLPFNEHLIFELSKQVVLGNQFDFVMQSVEDFQNAENKMWAGRVWANLASVRPISTREMYSVPPAPIVSAPGLSSIDEEGGAADMSLSSTPTLTATVAGSAFEGGLEHLLRIIFTKFAGREFAEGIFVLRAEFGADWFSPILQHPYCILRHTLAPAPIEVPVIAARENDSGSTGCTNAAGDSAGPRDQEQEASSTLAVVNSTSSRKRQKLSRASSTASALSVATTADISDVSTAATVRGTAAAATNPAQLLTVSVQPPFESFAVFYLGPHVKEFCSVFRSVALVPGINSWCAIVGGSATNGFVTQSSSKATT
ncbi:hypothetical protein HDU83_001168 [Entophlyctis luteolus]|nr:hypothetical protein HDU83_001168 [Entophlyctis luteolus]